MAFAAFITSASVAPLVLISGDLLDQERADQIVVDYVRSGSLDAPDQESSVRHQALQLAEIAEGATAITGEISL